MTDLHTHILPGMDDGAPDVETSIEMLRMEAEQGVDTVVLTPHFYRNQERPEAFLERRRRSALKLARALEGMPAEDRDKLPQLLLGAEVAWVPNLADLVDLSQFCLGKSRYFLLEPPFVPWYEDMVDQLYSLMGRTGLTPVIAHLERYLGSQKPDRIREMLDLGAPIQVSAGALSKPLSKSMKLLRGEWAQLVASDCHNTGTRRPNLGPAMELVGRRLGRERRSALERQADRLADEVRG